MRRDSRRNQQKNKGDRIIIYSSIGVVVLLTVVFTLLTLGKTSNNNSEKLAEIVENKTNTEAESASSSIGKSIEEEEAKEIKEKKEVTQNENTAKTTNKSNVTTKQTSTANNNNTKKDKTVSNETKELSFQKPLDGEITQEFAKENLVYSKTLQEWVTHSGIDIQAEKATVVQAAEDGTVKSIKNDPRYGLTIIIEHENGYQTLYANLLSTEFVAEGEKVVKGQSIGTVGNTAVFECAEDPHLHFEILKDSVQVDPSIYIK